MAKKDRWFLPTNTENLKLIIAQGLIATSDGFEKYYKDHLQTFHGKIPLFKNKILSEVLDLVLSEEQGLTACLIEIEMSQISGVMDTDEIQDASNLLIDAPLPLSTIKQIIFISNIEKENFENDAKLSSNLVLTGLKLKSNKTDQKLFEPEKSAPKYQDFSFDDEKKSTEKIDESSSTWSVGKTNYPKVYAFGGALANLFYFAKNGQFSNDWFQHFCNFNKEGNYQNNEEVSLISNYFLPGIDNLEAQSNIKQKMYQSIIDITIDKKDFKDKVLQYLESDTWDEKSKKRTQEIAKKLKDLHFAKGPPASEYLKESSKPLEKILIILFLREDTEALIDYENQTVLFDEEEYLLFALMFGIRDKFTEAPKFLREYAELQLFVSYKMAEYAHFLKGSKITFEPPKIGKTIYQQCFPANNTGVNEKLVRALDLNNCIYTTMPAKEFTHKKGKNTYLGYCKPTYEIDETIYFEYISKLKITSDMYNKITSK